MKIACFTLLESDSDRLNIKWVPEFKASVDAMSEISKAVSWHSVNLHPAFNKGQFSKLIIMTRILSMHVKVFWKSLLHPND